MWSFCFPIKRYWFCNGCKLLTNFHWFYCFNNCRLYGYQMDVRINYKQKFGYLRILLLVDGYYSIYGRNLPHILKLKKIEINNLYSHTFSIFFLNSSTDLPKTSAVNIAPPAPA